MVVFASDRILLQGAVQVLGLMLVEDFLVRGWVFTNLHQCDIAVMAIVGERRSNL